MTKNQSNTFVKGARQMLIGLGATEFVCEFGNDSHNFKLQTKLGELFIKLRKAQSDLYMIFSVYLDDEAVEKAKKELGHWKYNCMYNCEHNTPEKAVEFAKCHFEELL